MKIKKNRHWDPAAHPTFWVNHASRLLMRRFEQRLRPLDFGMAYMPVVGALEENGTLLQKQLAEHAHVEQPTMAALINRMDRDGLIVRREDPHDKRSMRLSLSAKAIKRLPEAKARLQEIADAAMEDFSESEKAVLLTLLRRLVVTLEAEGLVDPCD